MSDLYDIVEKCLVEIEQGADVDTVLFRYPEFADELRPILETSVHAMELAAPDPAPHIVHLNRAKLLKHAAEMRTAKARPASRFWTVSLRRLAVTLAILLLAFAGGNGLVHASTNTVPGDNLYPVKRTWEDILVLFTFNPQERETLEVEHENERLEELRELFAEGRTTNVVFSGYVTHQNGTEWRVSTISVAISPQTELPANPVAIGAAVRISGVTQPDGSVLAYHVQLLPSGIKLPVVNDDNESGSEEQKPAETQAVQEQPTAQTEEESHSGYGIGTPPAATTDISNDDSEPRPTRTPVIGSGGETTITPDSSSQKKEFSFKGTIQSISNNIWTVNGHMIDVSKAEIHGSPAVGKSIKVEGYITADGTYMAKDIEVFSGSSGDHESDPDD